MTTELQVAIDDPRLPRLDAILFALSTTAAVARIEIGTPLLTTYGTDIVNVFTRHIETPRLYADLKCVDFVSSQLRPYLERGIVHVSVHICAEIPQVVAALELVEKYRGCLYVSTLGYPDSALYDQVTLFERTGCDTFIFHGEGVHSEDALNRALNRYSICHGIGSCRRILAGGISASNLTSIPLADLDGIIVGRGVTGAPDPQHALVELVSGMRNAQQK